MAAQVRVQTKWAQAALVLVLLLAWALGLHQLGVDSLWLDEILTASTVQARNVNGVLEYLKRWPDVRPLHSLLMYMVWQIGETEFWLRLPSVGFGLLSLVLTYQVGRILLGRAEAAWGILLLAVSPFHLRYMQEARPYTLFLWLSLLSLHLFLWAWRSGRWWRWAAFALVSALNLYTHYFAAFILAAELGVGGVLLGQDLGKRNLQRERLVGLVASVAAIGLAMLPSLPAIIQFPGKDQNNDVPAQRLTWSGQFLVDTINQLGVGVKAGPHLTPYTWLLLVLCLVGLLALGWQKRWKTLLWIVLWTALPFLVLSLVPSWHVFQIRYVIFVLPILLLAAARGLAVLVDGLAHLLRSVPNSRPLATGLLTFGVLALSIAPLQSWYARQKQPWRELAALLNTYATPGDVVITEPSWFVNCLRYYGYEFAHTVSGSAERFDELTAEAQAVWYIRQNPPGSVADPTGRIQQRVDQSSYQLLMQGDVKEGWINVYYRPSGSLTLSETVPMLQSFTRLDQNNAELWHLLGEAYRAQGTLDQARLAYQRAWRLEPENPRRLVNLGRAYAERGDVTQGMTLVNQAIEINPQTPGHYVVLGDLLVQDGEVPAALDAYDRAATLNPDYRSNAWYYLRLGRAYRRGKRFDEAIAAYEQALALDETNEQAARWLEELRR